MDKKFTLGERTFEFSKNLIKYLRSLQTDSLKQPILLQAIRSGTSVGANYQEAEGRESPKDFIHKVMISKKEAKETIYWLKLLENGYDVKSAQLTYLIDECDQLIRIFGKISTSAQTDI